MRKVISLVACMGLAVGLAVAQQPPATFPKLTGPYLGQKPPGKTAEPFAPEVFASVDIVHGSLVFSPDGTEAYWSLINPVRIIGSKISNGVWTKPEVVIPNADVPFISPDGLKFYFLAQKVINGQKAELLSVMDKTSSGWSAARPVSESIGVSLGLHWQVSVDGKGSIYFGTRGRAGEGVNVAEYADSVYRGPKIVEALRNVAAFSPYIAPDGSYLIVTEVHEGVGLYILFRKSDGTWTKRTDIGPLIGASGEMLCPVVSHDDKYLFFLKGEGERTVPYWVDASFIEGLKKSELTK